MAIGTPTLVGFTTGITASQTSATVTTTAAIPAGALILVSIARYACRSDADITSISDPSSNTYVAAKTVAHTPTHSVTSLWYAVNAAAVGNSSNITINGLNMGSSNDSWAINIYYVTGMANATPVDVSNSATGTASPWSSGSITTTNGSDLVWGVANVVVVAGSPVIVQANCTPTSGWSLNVVRTASHTFITNLLTCYQRPTVNGTYSIGGTSSGFTAIALIVAFDGGATTVSSGSVNLGTNDVSGLTATGTSIVPENVTAGTNGGGLQATGTSIVPENVTAGTNGCGLQATGTSIVPENVTAGTNGSGLTATGGVGTVSGIVNMGGAGSGLTATGVQSQVSGVVDLGGAGGISPVVYLDLLIVTSSTLGSGGGGVVATGTSIIAVGVTALGANGGGLTATALSAIIAATIKLGAKGGGLLASATQLVASGVFTLGAAGGIAPVIGGVFVRSSITFLGDNDAGLLASGHIGDPFGHWVAVTVWIWRSGAWNLCPVKVWRSGAWHQL